MNKAILLATVGLFFSLGVVAQKLPSIQKESIRTPQGIKIDGKSIEWKNNFQAYNGNTNIFYTLSNDDTNLYLVVQSRNAGINSKILIGGLTLTINTSGDKKDKNGVSVMFPFLNEKAKRTAIGRAMAGLKSWERETNPEVKKRQMDSVSYAMNRTQIDKLKEIRVIGIKEIQDTVISIYNEQDILARALFEDQNTYTYELALPLKYLNLSAKSAKTFVYNITLNGVLSGFGDRGPGIIAAGSEGGRPAIVGPGGMDVRVLALPTDFWGKYTLAK
ncbi:MAG: hypothetical protein H7Y13_14730 [Sphingobacteriaceae bacterium]|nr:hypothetical protein [Sphingobacteriaceae bacterium]